MWGDMKTKLEYHFLSVEPRRITDAWLSMLTSPEYFTTQREMWSHRLQEYRERRQIYQNNPKNIS